MFVLLPAEETPEPCRVTCQTEKHRTGPEDAPLPPKTKRVCYFHQYELCSGALISKAAFVCMKCFFFWVNNAAWFLGCWRADLFTGSETNRVKDVEEAVEAERG